MRRKKKRIIKKAIKSFDLIYGACRKLSDSYDFKTIPIVTYKEILKKAKLKKDKDDPEGVKDFADRYNSVIDKMMAIASKDGHKVISVEFIKTQCDFVKNKIKEGYDTHPDNKRPDKKV